MSFDYEQSMECFKKKEKRLRNLKYASGSDIVINVNCELLNGLKENVGDYFYIANIIWNNDGEHILFSPKQAFDIYNKCNILLFNTTYPHSCDFILPLTEGYCKIASNTKKENMKILFLNNSMNRILYQINSPEKINKLLSWLKEILTIGDYNTEDEPMEQEVKFVVNPLLKTILCQIDDEIKGSAKCNEIDKFDSKKGKLISFARALDFDTKTVNRIIDTLFQE